MPCRATKKIPGDGRPAFMADSCAFQKRRGVNGRMYVSQPNDRGQYVWVPVPDPLHRRVAGAGWKAARQARRVAGEYGPLAASKVVHAAARHAYGRMVPGGNFDNALSVTYGPQYYDAFHASARRDPYYARYG